MPLKMRVLSCFPMWATKYLRITFNYPLTGVSFQIPSGQFSLLDDRLLNMEHPVKGHTIQGWNS